MTIFFILFKFNRSAQDSWPIGLIISWDQKMRECVYSQKQILIVLLVFDVFFWLAARMLLILLFASWGGGSHRRHEFPIFWILCCGGHHLYDHGVCCSQTSECYRKKGICPRVAACTIAIWKTIGQTRVLYSENMFR